MNNYNEFLKYMHGENKSIVKVHKYVEKLNRKAMSILFNTNNVIEENKLGDIYFIVNSGGDKNEMITNFNAVFVDLDCGRDKNDNYYSLEVANEYKNKKLKEIEKFDIMPTFIIETRNGLHVYWVLKSSTNIEAWKNCIDKLIVKFDGDKQVNNPARLMRLPFTTWMKDICNPYDIKIVEFNDIRYDIGDILNSLSHIQVEDEICGYSSISINKILHNTITTKTLPLIISGEIEALQNILKVEPLKLHTENEFYTYMTQEINLYDFLGVQGSPFRCIFHDDKSPSAGIFISERGQYFYKCHSANCGFKGNIIHCVEKLKGFKSRPDAINFIKMVYKLSIEDTEWQRKQKTMLEENKRMMREGEFEEYYPDIYKLIKNYLDLFYLMHDVAIDNVYDEKLTDDDNNVVFFASVTRIMEILNYKNRTKISDRNALFAFLKLLNKLPDGQIPSTYLEKAKEARLKNKQFYNVSFFSIPSYCVDLLDESEIRAAMYKENNVSMRGWSRELLQRTFGDELANEIYPQFIKRKISKKSHKITKEIHELIISLIDAKGYATEKEVLEAIVIENTKKGLKVKESTQTQIKKSLQEMLDTYGLERIRCNNKIKDAYGVVSDGYPFIIVQKEKE